MRYFIAFNKVELPFESSIYPGSFLILRRPIPFSECLNKKITVIFRITHLRLPLQLSVSMIFSTTIPNVEHQNRNMLEWCSRGHEINLARGETRRRRTEWEHWSEINPGNVIQSVTNVTTANETSELDWWTKIKFSRQEIYPKLSPGRRVGAKIKS